MIIYDIDTVIDKGTTHEVCEDYILSERMGENFDAVVLCDGCSSAPFSSVGAQILSHAVMREIRNSCIDIMSVPLQGVEDILRTKILPTAMRNSIQAVSIIRDDTMCLLCTVSVLLRVGDNFHVYRVGDGSLIIEEPNTLYVISAEYISEGRQMPYYLLYDFMNADIGSTSAMTKMYQDEVQYNISQKIYNKTADGMVLESEYKGSPIDKVNTSYYRFVVHGALIGIYIASDGIDSFIHAKTKQSATDERVLHELFDIRSNTGKFLKRTVMSKFGAMNTLLKEGITHYDDFCMGGFRIS